MQYRQTKDYQRMDLNRFGQINVNMKLKVFFLLSCHTDYEVIWRIRSFDWQHWNEKKFLFSFADCLATFYFCCLWIWLPPIGNNENGKKRNIFVKQKKGNAIWNGASGININFNWIWLWYTMWFNFRTMTVNILCVRWHEAGSMLNLLTSILCLTKITLRLICVSK